MLIAELQIGSKGSKPLVYIVVMLLKSAYTYDLLVKCSCAFDLDVFRSVRDVTVVRSWALTAATCKS